jgi:hypothetical protein
VAYARKNPQWSTDPFALLIYDVSKDARANRAQAVSDEMEQLRSVGIPVYPDWNRNRRAYIGRLQVAGEKPTQLRSPIRWLSESALTFVVCQCTASVVDAGLSAILLDLGPGLDKARTQTRSLDATTIVDTRSYENRPLTPAHAVFVKEIEPLKIGPRKSRVRVVFADMTGRKIPSLDVDF